MTVLRARKDEHYARTLVGQHTILILVALHTVLRLGLSLCHPYEAH